MNLRDELERIDSAVIDRQPYGFEQTIWRRMLDALNAVDELGVAIADAGYTWTPEMRAAFERATETTASPKAERKPINDWHPKGYHMRGRG